MMDGSAPLTVENSIREEVDDVVVRFAGDSGDGIQITGGQFTLTTALAGNDLSTFPDFPAEIRAPQGTTFGVSAFQSILVREKYEQPVMRRMCWLLLTQQH